MGCATAPQSKCANNFSGEQSGSSASTYLSLQTLYIRRAFTYVAGENWGIVRLGEADGVTGETPTNTLVDGLAIRATLPVWQHLSAPPCMAGSPPVIAVRPSRTSHSHSRRRLGGWAGRSSIYRDEGIGGTRGRDKRPGLALKGVARREFDTVTAWSVRRLRRSSPT